MDRNDLSRTVITASRSRIITDSSEDRMAVSAAKWLHRQGCHALAMSPDRKDYGHHNYPLERFGKAIAFLKSQPCEKIGIVGAAIVAGIVVTL